MASHNGTKYHLKKGTSRCREKHNIPHLQSFMCNTWNMYTHDVPHIHHTLLVLADCFMYSHACRNSTKSESQCSAAARVRNLRVRRRTPQSSVMMLASFNVHGVQLVSEVAQLISDSASRSSSASRLLEALPVMESSVCCSGLQCVSRPQTSSSMVTMEREAMLIFNLSRLSA